jgi:hypothetical protein
MIAADKFADKSLTSRRFEGGQDAQREGKHVDLPELDVAGQSQHREQRGLHHFKREDHHEEARPGVLARRSPPPTPVLPAAPPATAR